MPNRERNFTAEIVRLPHDDFYEFIGRIAGGNIMESDGVIAGVFEGKKLVLGYVGLKPLDPSDQRGLLRTSLIACDLHEATHISAILGDEPTVASARKVFGEASVVTRGNSYSLEHPLA